MRGLAAGTESENERLLGQRNGRGESQAEGAEVGHGGDGTAGGIGGQATRAGEFDEFRVTRGQFA